MEDLIHHIKVAKSINLISGEHYVASNSDEVLVTILGSCVSCCIRDPIAKVGGMNHFLLPGSSDPHALKFGNAARFGSYAMEVLINEIISKGGMKQRFEIKIFGGGHVINHSVMIGNRNIAFVRDYIRQEGMSIYSEDVGGIYPRKVHYYPMTGKVMVRQLNDQAKEVFAKDEVFYKIVSTKPIEGDAELF